MPARPQRSSSIIGLDLLRGGAALVVFVGHVRGRSFVAYGKIPASEHGIAASALFGLSRLGHEAVLAFFVLSGFLVGGQILRRVRDGTFRVSDYAIDRCTRIFVPLIPACLLTVGIGYFALGQSFAWGTLLANMIGLSGVIAPILGHNPPLWTLSYEIWFYILAGAIGYSLYARRASSGALLAIGCGVAVFTVLLPRYFLFWSMGALLVLYVESRYRAYLAVAGVLAAAAGTVTFELSAASVSFTNRVLLPPATSEFLICLGIALVLPFLCDPRSNRLLAPLRGPAAYLSAISYSLYLTHFPFNDLLEPYLPQASALDFQGVMHFLVRLGLIFLLVNLFYLAFEARTPMVRRMLRNHREKTP